MRLAYIFAVLLVITGCASPSRTPQPVIKWNTSHNPGTLIFDDTDKVFSSVFGDKTADWFSKRNLENEAEFRQRITKAGDGIVGKEITFFIPPNDCDVEAKPDEKSYFIKPKQNSLWPLWVKETVHGYGSTVMQNALGASIRVRQQKLVGKGINIENRDSLPAQVMRSAYDFGISISTAGNDKIDSDFRKWAAEKRVGIAIRGRIADLAKANIRSYTSKATFTSPIEQDNYLEHLPFTVDAVSLIIVGEDKVPKRLIEFVKP